MTDRPAFLATRPATENGANLIAAFRALTEAEQKIVDRWFTAYGVMQGLTWQEDCLLAWINDADLF
jgi:ABC-type taurine transport system ATPase subunit